MDGLIEAAVSGVRASFAVVIGPAGIGKTRLLDAVEQRAGRAGLRVLRASGAEFERGLAFGGAVQLFDAPLRAVTDDERAELLEGAARLGGELLGFGVDGVPDTAPVPSFSAFHGLYWLCVNLAAGSALALLVDDAHWLDEPSLGWIEYLSRRFEGLSILVALATRPEEVLGQRLADTAIEIGGDVIELRPLSGNAVHALMETTLRQDADARVLRRRFNRSPAATRSWSTSCCARCPKRASRPDAGGARAVLTLGSNRIGRAVLLRLHRLSPAAVALARAIAILGRGASVTVAARLADLDDATAAQAHRDTGSSKYPGAGIRPSVSPFGRASLHLRRLASAGPCLAPPPGRTVARRDGGRRG